MIGGLLIIFIQPWLQLDPQSFIAAYFYLLAFIFIAIGITGHYLVQYKEIGGFGFFSFLLLSAGLYLWIGYHWFLTFVYPDIYKSVPNAASIVLQSMDYGKKLALYTMLPSILLFSGLSMWKGILSRWSTAMLVLTPFMIFIPYGLMAAHLLGGISLIWSGITLCKIQKPAEGEEDDTEDEEEDTEDEEKTVESEDEEINQEVQKKMLEANQ